MLSWIEGNHKLHITVGYQTESWSSAPTRETNNLACELHSEGRSTYRQEKFVSLLAQQAVHPWTFLSGLYVPGFYLPSGASHPASTDGSGQAMLSCDVPHCNQTQKQTLQAGRGRPAALAVMYECESDSKVSGENCSATSVLTRGPVWEN